MTQSGVHGSRFATIGGNKNIGETMNRFITLLILPLLLTACSSTQIDNNTTYAYQLNKELMDKLPGKKLIIAPVNLGIPSRNYLQASERRIDNKIEKYLKNHGYDIVPNLNFELLWRSAEREYGQSYDPTTGKQNQRAFTQALISTTKQLIAEHGIDGIVFTDLLELEIQFSSSMKHYARWHGVTRKPSLQGPGEGVSMDFDWSKAAKGASLWVNIYNADLQRIFTSMGGLDTTQAIDTKASSARYTRRKQILKNNTFVEEGIQLAFHPFIPMKNYPGQ
jgi:hypothetical protein